MCAGGGVQNCMEDGLHNFSIVETVSGPPGVVQFLIAGYNGGYRDGRYFYEIKLNLSNLSSANF